MQQQDIVIVGMARTPMGGLQGDLAHLSAGELGAAAIRAAVVRAGVAADQVEEVIMGNVLGAGQGQAPARQAALKGGLPESTACLTINKMCGSGMKAVMLAHDQLKAGSAAVMVAGGMESMSRAPYIIPKARTGLRLGHGELKDHMFLDGLEDAYDKGQLMGVFAEQCAEHYGFTRAAQDAYALESLARAQQAIESGAFSDEIVALEGERAVSQDEQPLKARPDKIPQLKPAFRKDGTVTAANASSISDGAAALVLMTAAEAARRGLTPLARIVGHATHAQAPAWFTTAPVGAMKKLLAQTGWSVSEVDLFEVNEAFAVVAMAAMRELDLPHARLNVRGGACALGHPIGASGARILVTLISALRQTGGRRGVASLCIGGGEATAMAIELM
ncbi:acetyl-CoA C-acyltransferase [Paludibacterium sp. B53371]|nr:acetyl-CoA C-acyltransferase [Paludibacterium sp. B53371]BEV70721.1 acetyl-CoA C-acetyltransferase [Paludibacterium sp. THUN1379]